MTKPNTDKPDNGKRLTTTNEMIRGALACDRPPSGPTLYHNIYRAMIAATRGADGGKDA